MSTRVQVFVTALVLAASALPPMGAGYPSGRPAAAGQPPGGLTAPAAAESPYAEPSPPVASSQIPDWFLQDIETKTRGSGIWITDNSAYREEDGGIEAYGIEWKKGIGGMSVVGRLFSLRDGEELATHWEFRSFWHPVEKVAKAYQFGADGTLGQGDAHPGPDPGSMIVEQTFAAPDGTVTRIRHETRTEGDHETGRSLNWIDGQWQPRRTYTWILQR